MAICDRESTKPRTGAVKVYGVLESVLLSVAESGRLTVPVETAAAMIYAAGIGVALSLITNYQSADTTDLSISERTRDAVIEAVTTSAGPGRRHAETGPEEQARRHAVSLGALIPHLDESFTDGERHLLGEWLGRITSGRRSG